MPIGSVVCEGDGGDDEHANRQAAMEKKKSVRLTDEM